MRSTLELLVISLLIGTNAYAQGTSTVIQETQTTAPVEEKEVIHEKEVVPVPVEVPAPEQHTSSASSSQYSSKTVKKVEPAVSQKTTTSRRVSYRTPFRPVHRRISARATTTIKQQPQVIEKSESYSHSENNNTNTAE